MQQQMISHRDAQLRCPDKKTLYQSCIRNQYLLSPFKDSINTVRFLQGVQSKRYWAMKSEDVLTVKFCADPPKKKELAKILHGVMSNFRKLGEPMDSGMRRTAKHIRKKPPQFSWMMLMLSNLEPDHEIFAKDYVNPKKTVAAEELVNSFDDFYSGLPVVHGHRGRMLNLTDRHEQKRKKLIRMQTHQDKLADRI